MTGQRAVPPHKPNSRAATPGEIEAYRRNLKPSGGGPGESLMEKFRRKVDDITLPLRNRARGITRLEIFALEDAGIDQLDPRMRTLDLHFNMIARGGVVGAMTAFRVLLTRPPHP